VTVIAAGSILGGNKNFGGRKLAMEEDHSSGLGQISLKKVSSDTTKIDGKRMSGKEASSRALTGTGSGESFSPIKQSLAFTSSSPDLQAVRATKSQQEIDLQSRRLPKKEHEKELKLVLENPEKAFRLGIIDNNRQKLANAFQRWEGREHGSVQTMLNSYQEVFNYYNEALSMDIIAKLRLPLVRGTHGNNFVGEDPSTINDMSMSVSFGLLRAGIDSKISYLTDHLEDFNKRVLAEICVSLTLTPLMKQYCTNIKNPSLKENFERNAQLIRGIAYYDDTFDKIFSGYNKAVEAVNQSLQKMEETKIRFLKRLTDKISRKYAVERLKRIVDSIDDPLKNILTIPNIPKETSSSAGDEEEEGTETNGGEKTRNRRNMKEAILDAIDKKKNFPKNKPDTKSLVIKAFKNILEKIYEFSFTVYLAKAYHTFILESVGEKGSYRFGFGAYLQRNKNDPNVKKLQEFESTKWDTDSINTKSESDLKMEFTTMFDELFHNLDFDRNPFFQRKIEPGNTSIQQNSKATFKIILDNEFAFLSKIYEIKSQFDKFVTTNNNKEFLERDVYNLVDGIRQKYEVYPYSLEKTINTKTYLPPKIEISKKQLQSFQTEKPKLDDKIYQYFLNKYKTPNDGQMPEIIELTDKQIDDIKSAPSNTDPKFEYVYGNEINPLDDPKKKLELEKLRLKEEIKYVLYEEKNKQDEVTPTNLQSTYIGGRILSYLTRGMKKEFLIHLIANYNKKQENRKFYLAQLLCDLERIHPYGDFNARTLGALVLNKELLKMGESPSIMPQVEVIDDRSPEQVVKVINEGQAFYQNVFDGKLDPKVYPSNEELFYGLEAVNHLLEISKLGTNPTISNTQSDSNFYNIKSYFLQSPHCDERKEDCFSKIIFGLSTVDPVFKNFLELTSANEIARLSNKDSPNKYDSNKYLLKLKQKLLENGSKLLKEVPIEKQVMNLLMVDMKIAGK